MGIVPKSSGAMAGAMTGAMDPKLMTSTYPNVLKSMGIDPKRLGLDSRSSSLSTPASSQSLVNERCHSEEYWGRGKCEQDGSASDCGGPARPEPAQDPDTLSPRRQTGPLEVGEAFLDFHILYLNRIPPRPFTQL